MGDVRISRRMALKIRRYLMDMPACPDHITTNEAWTDYLTGADGTKKQPYPKHRNRQCSIGYHAECSDPDGITCGCPCHWIAPLDRALNEETLKAAPIDREGR